MTEAELITRVTAEIKSQSSSFSATDYEYAVDSAEVDTGFTLPTSTTTEIFWLVQRTKRHLLASLMIDNVTKFQVKQIHLDQKYKNLSDIIKKMDEDWKEAQNDPTNFLTGTSLFGTKIDAGFQYDSLGRETTYTDLNEVNFTPNESSEE